MKKRSKFRQNVQSRAFRLFDMGWSVLEVADEIGITISEARNHHLLFLQSSKLSPEKEQDVTQFLMDGYREAREKSVADLFCALSEIREKISGSEKYRKDGYPDQERKMDHLRYFIPEIEEALFSFNGIVWSMRRSPESGSLFIDRSMKLCFN